MGESRDVDRDATRAIVVLSRSTPERPVKFRRVQRLAGATTSAGMKRKGGCCLLKWMQGIKT
jgi:hypothetical protein